MRSNGGEGGGLVGHKMTMVVPLPAHHSSAAIRAAAAKVLDAARATLEQHGDRVNAAHRPRLSQSQIRGRSAGDGPRDGGEAGIDRLAPDVAIRNNDNGVTLPLVLAQEHGAGFEAPKAIRS